MSCVSGVGVNFTFLVTIMICVYVCVCVWGGGMYGISNPYNTTV